MDDRELILLLNKLDAELRGQVQMHVTGGALLVLHGVERHLKDIDILPGLSPAQEADLVAAAHKIGLDVDMGGFDPPDRFHLQLISKGAINFPEPDRSGLWPGKRASDLVFDGNRLTIYSAPLSICAASKLRRATDTDLQDLVAVITRGLCTQDEIALDARTVFRMERDDVQSCLDLVGAFSQANVDRHAQYIDSFRYS